MPKHPLAEVFGFPVSNTGPEASRYRRNRLCPYNNKVPNCTKDKAKNPLGVCSIVHGNEIVITCPTRFREDWIIAEDAAQFFFPQSTHWTTLTEIRLSGKHGKFASNIDIVIVAYAANGHVTDFGALEVQAVYISGNVRNAFEYYMEAPASRAYMDWTTRPNYPRPDYVSSSRKRLAPQLILKGGILNAWKKQIAVAVNRGFYETLPVFEEVERDKANIAWLIYDLKHDPQGNRYHLERHKVVYTDFQSAMLRITTSQAGDMQELIDLLQSRMDRKLEDGHPPDTQTVGLSF